MQSITPRQLAAARALAGISQTELSNISGVSIGTIKRIEASGGQNDSFDSLRVVTLKKLIEGFVILGVVFEASEGRIGVSIERLK